MENNIRFYGLIFNIILLALSVVSLSYTVAALPIKAHEKTLYEIANHASSEQNPHIPVGKYPIAIGVNSFTNTIYVTNRDDDTVSVIDGSNNTKIGEDIPVGKKPSAIGVNEIENKIYVANSNDNTVSVIDGSNNTKIGEDIPVGKKPLGIGFNNKTNTIYVANADDDTVSVIDAGNYTKKGIDIPVGKYPSAIGVNAIKNKIYVVNSWYDKHNDTAYQNGTVSVIDGRNNLKIEDIPVGKYPSAIGVNAIENKIYVVNSWYDQYHIVTDGTVSVINGDNNTKVGEDFPVGKYPWAIANYEFIFNKIYVANSMDDTVSVIDESIDTTIGNIPVGKNPRAIGVNIFTNTIYVTNVGDDTVSVIDGEADRVLAQVTFNTEPFDGGRIECDKLPAPRAQQLYVYADSECIAKPNEGFRFVSWQENLGGNSSQILQFPSPSNWDSFLDFIHLRSDQSAILNITKFGSFTANFKALPPPIPTEYVATLFTVVATAFIGSWLVPTVIEWRKTKKQGNKLDHYYNEIKSLYNDGNLDSNDIEKLDKLKNDITDEYTKGKINKEQYDKLIEEISISYREIFTKELNSLNSLSKDNKVEQLSIMKSKIDDAHAK